MADDRDDAEKTEDPSQKRLDEAIKRGDVVKSQELSTWFVIAGGTLMMTAFSSSMSEGLTTTFRGILAKSYQLRVDGPGLLYLMRQLGFEVIAAVAIPLLLLALAALGGNLIQHRLVWTAEPLKPSFSKISPLAGLKRMFSVQALLNFAKGLLKLVIVGAILTALLWPDRFRLMALAWTDLGGLMPLIQSLSIKLMGAVVALLGIIAGADYFFQYRQWYDKQKMSLRDLKEEFRQNEGDPAIKGKLRQMRQQRARKRVIANVPKATVVITNPTHFAVALQYEKGMEAPVCVGKGMDSLALKIREIAGEHDIPIVENPPLARALHATVEIDEEIPPEHYKAVAEVIGFVMRLRRAVPTRQ
ncbi:MAG TPA: flagellar biosynthesis protein FlhB [Pseudolabrys sp.]|nr:flagellar biosynthesis protein FlhB [Pseudolabrys sp.]